jgi:starvation-inducible outer membrane lipoprotein
MDAREQRESEEAKQREQREQRESDSENERDSEEDEEESWIDMLLEGIIEPKNYREREDNIMKFLKEYLSVKIYNMEYSFRKRKVKEE